MPNAWQDYTAHIFVFNRNIRRGLRYEKQEHMPVLTTERSSAGIALATVSRFSNIPNNGVKLWRCQEIGQAVAK